MGKGDVVDVAGPPGVFAEHKASPWRVLSAFHERQHQAHIDDKQTKRDERKRKEKPKKNKRKRGRGGEREREESNPSTPSIDQYICICPVRYPHIENYG
jgi:hypothetical protein